MNLEKIAITDKSGISYARMSYREFHKVPVHRRTTWGSPHIMVKRNGKPEIVKVLVVKKSKNKENA